MTEMSSKRDSATITLVPLPSPQLELHMQVYHLCPVLTGQGLNLPRTPGAYRPSLLGQ